MSDNNNSKKSINEQIEDVLQRQYDFRFNSIKCRTEFKPKDSGKLYKTIGKYELNTLKRDLDALGVRTTSENIRSILESSFAVPVNPVKEYLLTLKHIETIQRDSINLLATTVATTDSERWIEYFTRWIVGVCANALNDEKCLNQVCLVLCGEQGKFKTTWLDNLCPKPLKSYLYTGKINPSNKDIQTLIAECFLINIDDQLKALNKKDENELKNYISMSKVKYRRPYDVYIEEYPHLASFMGSINGNDFLTDPTGSRRFLPFEVLEIDINTALSINMNDVYSEAMSLYRAKFEYWFNDEEIDELHQYSQSFNVQTPEFELLFKTFEHPDTMDKDKYFMTTTDVKTYLQRWTSIQLRNKQMGEALKKMKFQHVANYSSDKKHSIKGYLLKKIEPNPFIDQ